MTGTTPGRPCLDLVATVHGRFDPDPLDDIATPASLAGWLERSSLLSGATPDEADAVAYLAVREAVFRLLGVVTGTADAPRPGDVAVVDAHARGSTVGLALGTGGVLLTERLRCLPAPPTSPPGMAIATSSRRSALGILHREARNLIAARAIMPNPGLSPRVLD